MKKWNDEQIKLNPHKLYKHLGTGVICYGSEWIDMGYKFAFCFSEVMPNPVFLYISAICFLSAILLIIKMLYFI